MKKLLVKVIMLDQKIAKRAEPYLLKIYSCNAELYSLAIMVVNLYWEMTNKAISHLQK